MDFSRQKFKNLIEELEEFAEADPVGYRWRVIGLACLGYGYLFLVLGVVAILAVCMLLLFYVDVQVAVYVNFVVGIPLLVGGWTVLRALFVRFEIPEGQTLEREDFSELFNRIDEIRSELDAPAVDKVILNGEFNAAIVEVPLFGVFGWRRNYLMLGLPLLKILSAREVDAVIAHEFGHLSENHGKLGAWIYRVRRTWNRLAESMAEGRGPPFLFAKFVQWFIPYFSAYSFVLARSEEYEADSCAAEVAGADVLGRALSKISVGSRILEEEYYPELEKRNTREPEPPEQHVSDMSELLESAVYEDAEPHLLRALNDSADLSDTHPSLSARLDALGIDETPTLRGVENSAAEAYLDEHISALSRHLDRQWNEAHRPIWTYRYEMAQVQREELESLRERAGDGDGLSCEEQWRRAVLTEQLEGKQQGLELYKEFLNRFPEDGRGQLAVAEAMLDCGDPEGVEYAKSATEKSELLVGDACELLVEYYSDRDNDEQVDYWLGRLDAFVKEKAKAERERDHIKVSDTFLPPDVEADTRDKLRSRLAEYNKIDKAFLVRKKVEHFPNEPFHILAIHHSFLGLSLSMPEVVEQLAEELDLPESIALYDLGTGGKGTRLLRKMRKIDGAQIDLD